MIPIRLRISGFLSYNDPVEIDFTSFDLACISGANGAGKSSLLDAMTWVLFGQARRKDESIINSRSQTAEVALEFDYESSHYRIQRLKTRGKSTQLEFQIKDAEGQWKPLTEHSITETEERIMHTLRMDYETFTNASFFLQGKADLFAQQKPAERKRILSSILGLDEWEIFRERATNRRKTVETELAGLGETLHEIESELEQEEERKKHLEILQESLGQAELLRKAQEEVLAHARQVATSLAEQHRMVEILSTQTDNARQRYQAIESEWEKRHSDLENFQERLSFAAEIETAYQAWQETRRKLEEWDKVALHFRQYESERSTPLLAIESERSRLQQELLGYQEQDQQIGDLRARLPEFQNQGEYCRQGLSELEKKLEEKPRLEEEILCLQQTNADSKAENTRLKEEMNELKERIDRLEDASGAVCPCVDSHSLPMSARR